ncbi:hypothetical protein C2W62_43110 [Candidatus Entotheonella serta]|nr:hypothetical protein C2W62_43110 [Candidatus Entotheonella serta]
MCPLQQKLESPENKCQIHTGVSVTGVMVEQSRVAAIHLQDTYYDEKAQKYEPVGTTREQPVDYLILAVPPKRLAHLVRTGTDPSQIAHILPKLADLRRLRTVPIPVLTLFFKMKLPHIPKEYMALLESRYSLTFVDTSQMFPEHHGTVLTLASSNFDTLPPKDIHQDGYDMITELYRYVPCFNPGQHWRDPEDELFLNEVGSEQWRPKTNYHHIPNLFFAGSFCKNKINIATVEAAVMSGLKAAQDIWKQECLGAPITIIEPETYPENVMMAMKLLMAPYAYSAKWWSLAHETTRHLASGRLSHHVSEQMIDRARLPYAFASDWWETAWSMLWRHVVQSDVPGRRGPLALRQRFSADKVYANGHVCIKRRQRVPQVSIWHPVDRAYQSPLEPAVDRGQQFPCFSNSALCPPQARQTGGRAEFPGFGMLRAGDVESPVKVGFSSCGSVRLPLSQQQLALESVYLGFVVSLFGGIDVGHCLCHRPQTFFNLSTRPVEFAQKR